MNLSRLERKQGTPLHRSCMATLRQWSAPSEEQDQLRRDYLRHLESHADGWSRHCAGAHLTASSLICAPEAPRVLLTLHARLRRWLQTGGHLEPQDTSLERAALREAAEESGLNGLRLDPVPLLLSRHDVPCGTTSPTFHLDVQFLVVALSPDLPRVSTESLDVRWFDVSRLPEVDASVLALSRAAAARLAW